MRAAVIAVAICSSGLGAENASACLPPPPGHIEASETEKFENFIKGATDIVYGVVAEDWSSGEHSRFKILHVYRGSQKSGAIIEAPPGWGYSPPQCAGMLGGPPPVPIGTYGVIAFRAEAPELNFIDPAHVQLMIEQGWIKSAKPLN